MIFKGDFCIAVMKNLGMRMSLIVKKIMPQSSKLIKVLKTTTIINK